MLKQEKIDPNDLRNAIIDQSSKGNLLSEENSPSVGSRLLRFFIICFDNCSLLLLVTFINI